MSLPFKSFSSANFYRFAAFCAACYIVAQIIQEFAFHHGISDSPLGEQAILQRLMPRSPVSLCGKRGCVPPLRSWASLFHFYSLSEKSSTARSTFL